MRLCGRGRMGSFRRFPFAAATFSRRICDLGVRNAGRGETHLGSFRFAMYCVCVSTVGFLGQVRSSHGATANKNAAGDRWEGSDGATKRRGTRRISNPRSEIQRASGMAEMSDRRATGSKDPGRRQDTGWKPAHTRPGLFVARGDSGG